ncbi:MAG TPA: WecB/TagA/CpsF family glycosyltransferase [Rhizobacter sp.]|nr:WecB/TagA/CpsF family glycosyltransferase [Rhizobacter sp.]
MSPPDITVPGSLSGPALPLGPAPADGHLLRVLGVPVTDVSMEHALGLLQDMLHEQPPRAHAIYFVNAHTLNNACDRPAYRGVLQSADRVFGDGTGVRWAARLLHGVSLKDNVNGTDLVPLMFSRWANRGLRYYLLGNTPERIERAAAYAKRAFPGWELAGCHHGFLGPDDHDAVIDKINASGAHMLLVGMGNPKQEQWIHDHLPRLQVPLCLATGGLFDYWVGDLVRAPRWVRRIGYEWLHLLSRQPHKAGRYLIGNPKFLLRVVRNMFTGKDRMVQS